MMFSRKFREVLAAHHTFNKGVLLVSVSSTMSSNLPTSMVEGEGPTGEELMGGGATGEGPVAT